MYRLHKLDYVAAVRQTTVYCTSMLLSSKLNELGVAVFERFMWKFLRNLSISTLISSFTNQ